ncbi:hypothetical protein Sdagh_14340 [Streptomyces daghestanicus]|uniref:Uncharacterized protein n=1 Tax=Streptomyces daghestanicus TaxID=66885 RepID=A0ABQ3PXG6_9ACTN|nr:hypothetical protein Sdagh_14340 [Streptomyces daghestanicus]
MAAVIAVMAGWRAGIWKMAEPTSMRSVWAATQVSTVAASEPYASAAQQDGVAEAVGLLGDGQIVRVHPTAPVAEVDPELHGRSPY